MIANAHNEKPSWGASLRQCFCIPFAKKRDHKSSSSTASKGRLSDETLPVGGDEKHASIVREEPAATPRPSMTPSTPSQKFSSSTTINAVEENAEILRSKFAPPTPPPKSLARGKKQSVGEFQLFPSPSPVYSVVTMRHQSWPPSFQPVDTTRTIEFRRSLPPPAFCSPVSPTAPAIPENSALVTSQKTSPPTARRNGKGRSRSYSMPVHTVKRHIATLVKVELMPDSPTVPLSPDGMKYSATSVRPHISICSRSTTIPPSPHTPLSFDVSLSKFPLPPSSRPLLLEPATLENRKSLSFVNHWLYLQTNESFVTLDTDIPTPLIKTEFVL